VCVCVCVCENVGAGHFVERLAGCLQVAPPPPWLNKLARTGERLGITGEALEKRFG
jgi:hypothetical protein